MESWPVKVFESKGYILQRTPQSLFAGSFKTQREDEAELREAAVQNLSGKGPTFLGKLLPPFPGGLRKRTGSSGSNLSSGGSGADIQIKDYEPERRRQIVEEAMATSDPDHEAFLASLKARMDRVGIEMSKIDVRFEDLTISAQVNVASRSLPNLRNTFFNSFEAYMSRLPGSKKELKRTLTIIDHASGVLQAGRMVLLLGPPSSGKSTLLKALAGKLQRDASVKVLGNITYNGKGLDKFVVQRTASYVEQVDRHMGELTVRETLDYAARCQGVGHKADNLQKLRELEKKMGITPDPTHEEFLTLESVGGQRYSIVTDYIIKMMGLDFAADTLVGDEMIRGISGGQKKRVTTGEIIVGPKKVLFMDEISTGLDSSTTHQVVRNMRNFVHTRQGTVLMSLLQPAPETYELFDDIMLLSEGSVVFFGPKEDVMPFFESLGFHKPVRKNVADFLQEVTSRKDQAQYWADKSVPRPFMTSKQMAEAFKTSPAGLAGKAALEAPVDEAQQGGEVLMKEKYGQTWRGSLRANLRRELTLTDRNRLMFQIRIFQEFILAFATATIFFRTRLKPDSVGSGNSYLSICFFTLNYMMLDAWAEMSVIVQRLPVFYKQRDEHMLPAWAFVLPVTILRIPYSFVVALLWSGVVYYVTGLAPSPGRFFTYLLVVFMFHTCMMALLRMVGAIGRTNVVANTLGSFTFLAVIMGGGFLIAKDDIPPWWIWAYWISPLSWAQVALNVNEMTAKRWDKPYTLDAEPVRLGNKILSDRNNPTDYYRVWVSIAVLAGYSILCNLGLILACKYLGSPETPNAVIPEDHPEDLKPIPAAGVTAADKAPPLAPVVGDVEMGQQVQTAADRGMSLPFTPLSLTFKDVWYSVPMPPGVGQDVIDRAKEVPAGEGGKMLPLLRNVSGAFRPGVLTALMGASGAGKTTLMDVLAGRKTGGKIDGDIRVGGHPKVQASFARISGYCEQTDIHSPCTTVKEALLFSAHLRLVNDSETQAALESFVQDVMDLVELTPLEGQIVGLPGVNGLSVEQRKRLTIGVELVANPSIIFMDEPTSGLDARAAAIVMRTVRNTVNTGRTVVCTIHQPSIDIFEAFDELALMKRGGELIFFGKLGVESANLVAYLEAIPGVPKIDEGLNPATWMLDVTTPGMESKLGVNFTELFRNSELSRYNDNVIQQLTDEPAGPPISFPTPYSQSTANQFRWCLWKNSRAYYKNPEYNAARIVVTFVIAIVFGTIFWQRGQNKSTMYEVFNISGALFASTLFLGWTNASTVQPVVAIERTVFYRERAAGMYSVMPYAFAQQLVEVPYILLQAIVYSTICYMMIGFRYEAGPFFWFMFFMWCTLTYMNVFGMMCVALSPALQLSAVVSVFFFATWQLFCGFVIARPSMPGWWIWYYFLCPVSWSLYGLTASQLGDLDPSILIPIAGTNIKQPLMDFLDDYFGFKYSDLWIVLLVLLGYIFAFSLAAMTALKRLNFQVR